MLWKNRYANEIEGGTAAKEESDSSVPSNYFSYSLTSQAIDRIHRIGQLKPVTVKRLVIEDTVEERLLGVRRSLAVDQTPNETGTQLCGARVMDAEESAAKPRAKPKPRRGRNYASDDAEEAGEDEDRRRKQRLEMLEKLFGCSTATVHKV